MEKIEHTEITVNGWIVRLMKKQDEIVDWITKHEKMQLHENDEVVIISKELLRDWYNTRYGEAWRGPGG